VNVLERARRSSSDPLVVSCWIAGILIALAFVSFLAAWKGASGTTRVDVQVAYLTSGGLGGLALLVAGAALLTIQLNRWLAARERRELDAVLDAARIAIATRRRGVRD
jgi:uncharacterized membrane protein